MILYFMIEFLCFILVFHKILWDSMHEFLVQISSVYLKEWKGKNGWILYLIGLLNPGWEIHEDLRVRRRGERHQWGIPVYYSELICADWRSRAVPEGLWAHLEVGKNLSSRLKGEIKIHLVSRCWWHPSKGS